MRSRWKIFSSRSLAQIARSVRRPELDMETVHLASANAPRSGSEWLTFMRRLTPNRDPTFASIFQTRCIRGCALTRSLRVGKNHGPACVKTAGNFDPSGLRTVLPVADTDVFKALYYDREQAALRPNLTFVDRA